MANICFFLTRPKAKKSGIFFLFSYSAFEIKNGKEKHLLLKHYIDESVELANRGNDRAKASKNFPLHLKFNTNLKRIEDIVSDTYRNLDLQDSPSMEKTRDLFLIGTYTGFRFSDRKRIADTGNSL